jgi:hypothetical protein
MKLRGMRRRNSSSRSKKSSSRKRWSLRKLVKLLARLSVHSKNHCLSSQIPRHHYHPLLHHSRHLCLLHHNRRHLHNLPLDHLHRR